MFLLRREFGISAYEAEHVLPQWERELLLRHHVKAKGIESGEDEPVGEPFSQPPKEF